ncbi:coadhesin-like [Dreissena polymorpha]|uniref:Uncharacterized protein n=1 Tax=Dreissena polymorpha TaxID=45954 RepID=A0A9D4R9W0_DREPO|nr:coadhesin-like [Dreissena polymorpha]KAH3860504.1 hypothetical protein DPMN_023404 [Dreissena polymorpha]
MNILRHLSSLLCILTLRSFELTGFLLTHSDGPTCYICRDIVAPNQCNVTRSCATDQICSIAATIDDTGARLFHAGCIETYTCQGPTLVGRKRDTLQCSQCCNRNLCNNFDCLHPTLTPTTQTIADCNDKSDVCATNDAHKVICPNQALANEFCPHTCGLCRVDGIWSSWSRWSSCTASCGPGHTMRVRSCDQPKPSNGGSMCGGAAIESQGCQADIQCPVDGHWSDWSPWRQCSATCGGGKQIRSRSCSDPVPQFGGKPCDDAQHFIEMRVCNTLSCPVDGHWAVWSPWLPCSVTCGRGNQIRTRNCSNPTPQFGGKPCDDALHFSESRDCNTHSCTMDGHWSLWSHWQTCSVTCGLGSRIRIRTCSNPTPLNGGHPCDNPLTYRETEPCTMENCSLSTSPATYTVMTPSSSCHDKPFCADEYLPPNICADNRIAFGDCPVKCGKCGMTTPRPVCEDNPAGNCNDTLYLQYACAQTDLSVLCSKSCHLCK